MLRFAVLYVFALVVMTVVSLAVSEFIPSYDHLWDATSLVLPCIPLASFGLTELVCNALGLKMVRVFDMSLPAGVPIAFGVGVLAIYVALIGIVTSSYMIAAVLTVGFVVGGVVFAALSVIFQVAVLGKRLFP